MSKQKDPATQAPIDAPAEGVHTKSNAGDRPWDVAPRAFEGLGSVPTVQGFQPGVFNDPSRQNITVMCVRESRRVPVGEPVNLLALFAMKPGKVIYEIRGGTERAEVILREGEHFAARSINGIARIVFIADGTTAELIGLPCGALSGFDTRMGHKSVRQTRQALQDEGKLACSACGGTDLVQYTQPEDPEFHPSPVWSAAEFARDIGAI